MLALAGVYAALASGCDECRFDSDCDSPYMCASGECVECEFDFDCRSGEYCASNLCMGASGCRGDGDCPPGLICEGARCITQEVCGDGLCEGLEDCSWCSDCGSCDPCGDGVCSGAESCSSCPADCGTCSTGTCADLPRRAYAGTNACLPLTSLASQVVDELVTTWGTQPTYLCRYDPALGVYYNACITPLPQGNAMYCPLDDSISYDSAFLSYHYDAYGRFAPITILAHEWGHLHQARNGLVNPGRTVFQNEQHADCQAGVFAAIAQMAGWLEDMDVMSAFWSLCSVSDAYWHPNGHGTCDQRANAFAHGYYTGLSTMSALCTGDTVAQALSICIN